MDANKLINFHRILVYLRNDIKNPHNVEIIEIMIKVYNQDNKEFIKMLHGKFDYVDQLLPENGKTFDDNNNVCEFINNMLIMIEESISANDYNLAYDIVDLIHFLPELLLENKRKHLKMYWKNNIKSFSKKWNNNTYKISKKYFVDHFWD